MQQYDQKTYINFGKILYCKLLHVIKSTLLIHKWGLFSHVKDKPKILLFLFLMLATALDELMAREKQTLAKMSFVLHTCFDYKFRMSHIVFLWQRGFDKIKFFNHRPYKNFTEVIHLWFPYQPWRWNTDNTKL